MRKLKLAHKVGGDGSLTLDGMMLALYSTITWYKLHGYTLEWHSKIGQKRMLTKR